MRKCDERTNPQSCFNKAKDDEYLFVLLQRDAAAPQAIATWIGERIRLGMNLMTDRQIAEAVNCIPLMGNVETPTGTGWWQVTNQQDGTTEFVNVIEVQDGLRVEVAGEEVRFKTSDARFARCRWAKR